MAADIPAQATRTPAQATETPTGAIHDAFDLPYPPSTNHLFQSVVTRTGKVIRTKSKVAKSYATEVGTMARRAFPAPLDGRVGVHIVIHPKRGVGIDIDNSAKAILDALKGICWGDDSQVWRLLIERAENRDGGGCSVRVESLT